MLRVALVTVLLGATRAAADPHAPESGGPAEPRPRAINVKIDGPAPFAAAELESALRVRLGERGVRVRVHATDDGVAIDTGGSERDVALAGRSGADAARLVALAAVDLMLPDLAEVPGDGIAATASAPATRLPITVGVLGSAALWSGPLAGASIDASLPVGRAIVGLEIGGGELVGGLDLKAAIVRASLGMRVGLLELRAGLTIEPITVGDGTGDSTVLLGAGASARFAIPLSGQVSFVVAAGLDAFATRTEYTRADMATVETPWFAPWFAAGLEVTP